MTETGPFYTDVQPGDIVYYNPLRQHHHHLRRDQLGPHPHQNGRNHLTDLNAFKNLPQNVEMRIEAR